MESPWKVDKSPNICFGYRVFNNELHFRAFKIDETEGFALTTAVMQLQQWEQFFAQHRLAAVYYQDGNYVQISGGPAGNIVRADLQRIVNNSEASTEARTMVDLAALPPALNAIPALPAALPRVGDKIRLLVFRDNMVRYVTVGNENRLVALQASTTSDTGHVFKLKYFTEPNQREKNVGRTHDWICLRLCRNNSTTEYCVGAPNIRDTHDYPLSVGNAREFRHYQFHWSYLEHNLIVFVTYVGDVQGYSHMHGFLVYDPTSGQLRVSHTPDRNWAIRFSFCP